MHLNTDELVDIAEGARPEGSAPHLAACGRCRAQLSDLRSMLSAAKEVDVPEPSPLFWDHLSSRVHHAVDADGAPRRWLDVAVWRRVLMPLSAVAVAGLLIAVAFNSRAMAPAPASSVAAPPPVFVAQAPPAVAGAGAPAELLSDVASDASLTLVASLTDDVDLETAREAGLAPRGSAEHAVTYMSDGELRELRRLLTEELARSGA